MEHPGIKIPDAMESPLAESAPSPSRQVSVFFKTWVSICMVRIPKTSAIRVVLAYATVAPARRRDHASCGWALLHENANFNARIVRKALSDVQGWDEHRLPPHRTWSRTASAPRRHEIVPGSSEAGRDSLRDIHRLRAR